MVYIYKNAPHIKTSKYKPGFFSKKSNCLELSNKCKTIKEFRNIYPRAYKISKKNNWIVEFFENKDFEIPVGYWHDIDRCKDAASKCKNSSEFQKKFSTAYNISYKNKWLKSFFIKNK